MWIASLLHSLRLLLPENIEDMELAWLTFHALMS